MDPLFFFCFVLLLSTFLVLLRLLKEIKEAVMEVKKECTILRNEVLGVATSGDSTAKSVGILEKKTLREIVEENQFDIKSIKTEMKNGIYGRYSVVEEQPECSEPLKNAVDNKENYVDAEASLDEYPVIRIKRKTIKEQRAWMEKKFIEERAKLMDPADGKSLSGTNVESISSSLPMSSQARTSCVLRLSNHLNSDLTEPQGCIQHGKKYSGPTNPVLRHTREAFSFQGDADGNGFVLSFRIRKDLRIAIACWTYPNGKVGLGMDVTPEGVRTDSLFETLSGGMKIHEATLESFIVHEKLLARAHMSPGPRSVVDLEILEIGLPRTMSIPSTPKNLAGLLEITNCLPVPLKSPRKFEHKGKINIALPSQVPPGTREILILSHSRVAEALFSYEIDSTDLGLLFAFRIQGNQNAFSAAFVPLPVDTAQTNFDSAMDPGQWKSHLYRKYANAQDAEQEIQIRNIRARVSMTEEEKPQLRMRIFAV